MKVGGSSKKNQEIGENWLESHPEESRELLKRLTKVVVDYLSAQVEAGAHMLQIFEAMGMMISPSNFEKYAYPCMAEVCNFHYTILTLSVVQPIDLKCLGCQLYF